MADGFFVTPPDEATLRFAWQHRNDDVAQLLLSSHPEVDIRAAARQIEGLQTAAAKWPTLLNSSTFCYPPRLNCEQASSEATANYKAQLCQRLSGPTAVAADLTGGMGIDTMALAAKLRKVHYIERNESLYQLAVNNFSALKISNIVCHNAEAENWIATTAEPLEVAYIDPARRDAHGRKVAAFEQCEPNLVALMPALLAHARRVVVKASPMIDIALAISQIGPIAEIHIMAVGGECKEVLFVSGEAGDIAMHCVCIAHGRVADFAYSRREAAEAQATYCQHAQRYLYVPHAALMKGGCFNLIGHRYELLKLDRNSHLYTSERLVADFPGRVFEIETTTPLSRKHIAPLLPDGRASVLCRNYPAEAADLQRQLRLRDGGSHTLVATTIMGRRLGLLCHSVQIDN
ncbi:MAG: SAM-dependent methyltransferase [Bacteroidales bacterium]|nr:SAM-dependent methyltransferase [Bacteroidales bacterium]